MNQIIEPKKTQTQHDLFILHLFNWIFKGLFNYNININNTNNTNTATNTKINNKWRGDLISVPASFAS